jgi:hypothetical protein
LPLPVSANIGARQLQQDDFAVRLAELLADFPEVPPGGLQLEVLETRAFEDMVAASTARVPVRPWAWALRWTTPMIWRLPTASSAWPAPLTARSSPRGWRRLCTVIGCELAQGYGISCPMPGVDLPAWVARWTQVAVWTA